MRFDLAPLRHLIGGALVLAALSVGLVACGRTLGPVSIGETTGTATAGTQAGQGGVTLALDNARYTANSAIVVTIHNTLSSTIVTTDHQSQCSMVTLERAVNGAWAAVDRCQQMILTRMIPLAAGSATQVHLTPRASGSSAPLWPAGTYRIVFSYSTGATGAAGANSTPGAGDTVYSATFLVA